jgi:5-methylcytosine-specific restriction endonuclease McrA
MSSRAWELTHRVYECLHPDTEIRYLITANGVKQYRFQCLTCGQWSSQTLKHADPRVLQMAEILPYDRELYDRYWEQRHDFYTRTVEDERNDETQRFWAEYSEYLQSPEWRAKSRAVLERDNYLCQACRGARATQVHHLTYKHKYREPLFELVAVCESCHDEITEMDRNRRGE